MTAEMVKHLLILALRAAGVTSDNPQPQDLLRIEEPEGHVTAFNTGGLTLWWDHTPGEVARFTLYREVADPGDRETPPSSDLAEIGATSALADAVTRFALSIVSDRIEAALEVAGLEQQRRDDEVARQYWRSVEREEQERQERDSQAPPHGPECPDCQNARLKASAEAARRERNPE